MTRGGSPRFRRIVVQSEMKLEQENQEPILNPSWDEVEAALLSIHPKEKSYFTLTNAKGSYVQVAGARLRLIIEHRRKSLFGFKHVVFGRTLADPERTSINYSGGAISLNRNEILSIDDAITIFRAFYGGKKFPDSYLVRNVTDEQK